MAEAAPGNSSQIDQEQDEPDDVALLHDLSKNEFTKEFRSVEVWLRGIHRIPAKEMRMGGQVAALVEIATYADREAGRIHPYHVERNKHGNSPIEYAVLLIEWAMPQG